MTLRPLPCEPTSCASYLLDCTGLVELAAVEPRGEVVDAFVEAATRAGTQMIAADLAGSPLPAA